MPENEPIIQPIHVYYSHKPDVHSRVDAIIESMEGTIEQNIARFRRAKCADVDKIIGKLEPHIKASIRFLRAIVRANEKFITHWRTGYIPTTIFPITLQTIIRNIRTPTEADMLRLRKIVDGGLLADIYRIDSAVVSSLCMRKFPIKWRLGLFYEMQKLHNPPLNYLIKPNVLTALFAHSRMPHESTISFDALLPIMKWAQKQFLSKKIPDDHILSDAVIATFISHPHIPLSEMSHMYNFAKNNGLLSLCVINAWNGQIFSRFSSEVKRYYIDPGEYFVQCDDPDSCRIADAHSTTFRLLSGEDE